MYLCVTLFLQSIKKKEQEMEKEVQLLAARKVANQERLAWLQRELMEMNFDFNKNAMLLRISAQDQEDTATTSTATGKHSLFGFTAIWYLTLT